MMKELGIVIVCKIIHNGHMWRSPEVSRKFPRGVDCFRDRLPLESVKATEVVTESW